MEDQTLWYKVRDSWQLIISSLGLPWYKFFSNLLAGWNLLLVRFRKGLYEVLDYEATLELKDKRGKRACVQKYEKVRYLQNNIVAFQDQAWGDGKILINYRCTPGIPVDTYRSGFKNCILISLREVKNQGDIDEFHIDWEIHQGFLRSTGFWASEISHYTDKIKMRVIFPKTRPPLQATVLEKNQQRTLALSKDSFLQLPDGKWEVTWERNRPRLYEQYILRWEW
jgi:hypothetical protein